MAETFRVDLRRVARIAFFQCLLTVPILHQVRDKVGMVNCEGHYEQKISGRYLNILGQG